MTIQSTNWPKAQTDADLTGMGRVKAVKIEMSFVGSK